MAMSMSTGNGFFFDFLYVAWHKKKRRDGDKNEIVFHPMKCVIEPKN